MCAEKVQKSGSKKKISPNDFIALYNSVMYKNHDEAAQRIELEWMTPCCSHPYSCNEFHKNQVTAVEVSDARGCSLEYVIKENQWPLVFDMCSLIINSKTYPTSSAVICILNYIL
ncbi:hypothetical protein L9F63_002374, partial [Diploptera punctata]